MKVIEITDSGYVWHIPVEVVADNRAKYYRDIEAKREQLSDEDATLVYKEEFDFVMKDSYEAIDWFVNNMNFSDVATSAVLVSIPKALTKPGPHAEVSLVESDKICAEWAKARARARSTINELTL
jgi:hypothetical protein